ncbi:unnamed protein product [Mesocestoides corti]|uniref:Uncharacterized protein n=1 Tax=Mesocestoides corti TaxID=53468 RepID=A0A0R3U154_MESCO|nr:unnamed protein product [Mesocestoides corti]
MSHAVGGAPVTYVEPPVVPKDDYIYLQKELEQQTNSEEHKAVSEEEDHLIEDNLNGGEDFAETESFARSSFTEEAEHPPPPTEEPYLPPAPPVDSEIPHLESDFVLGTSQEQVGEELLPEVPPHEDSDTIEYSFQNSHFQEDEEEEVQAPVPRPPTPPPQLLHANEQVEHTDHLFHSPVKHVETPLEESPDNARMDLVGGTDHFAVEKHEATPLHYAAASGSGEDTIGDFEQEAALETSEHPFEGDAQIAKTHDVTVNESVAHPLPVLEDFPPIAQKSQPSFQDIKNDLENKQ